MSGIQLQIVSKIYPSGFQVIHGVGLEIRDSEFIVLVRPSNCVKSALLRMIVGLEDITHSHIAVGEKYVNGPLPKERGVAMVFQSYALYPHMTVYKNTVFNLLGKMSKEEVDTRVRETVHELEIETLPDKKSSQLSGGQCQRVAAGRAIARKPDVFLFDEPLFDLGAKLRVSMRVRPTELHRQLHYEGTSVAMVYVTHDQTEAMTMGGRIYVSNGGRIMQVDAPGDAYHYSRNKSVVGFIDNPVMDIILLGIDSSTRGLCLADNLTPPLSMRLSSLLKQYPHSSVWLGIRSEATRLASQHGASAFDAHITNVERMDNEDLLHFGIGE